MLRRGDPWPACYALLFALAFVGYPFLSGLGSAYDFYSRELSIFMRAGVIALSFGTLWFAASRLPLEHWKDPALLIILTLWAALLARFLWDATMVDIPIDLPWWNFFLVILGVAFIPSFALCQTPAAEALDNARRWIYVLGTAGGVFTLIAVANLVLTDDKAGAIRRIGTESLNAISLGHLGCNVVIVSVLADPLRGNSWLSRLVDWRLPRIFAAVLGVTLVIASASKAPILALLAAILVWQLSRGLRKGGVRGLIGSALVVVSVVAILVLLALMIELFLDIRTVDRFINAGNDPSTNYRLGMMTRALQQFEHSPWLGSSFFEQKARFYPHNLLVETLMTTGIGGFCLLIALLAFSAAAASRLVRTRHSWLVMLYGQYIVGAMFSGTAYFDPQFWTITLAMIGADRMLLHTQTVSAVLGDARASAPA